MKFIGDIIKGARVVVKYGSLIMVVLGIVGFAADSLEKWQNDNPKLAGKTDGEGK